MTRRHVRRQRGPRALSLAAVVIGTMLPFGSLSAQAVDADSIPRYDLDVVEVSILRAPIQLGNSPFAVSVANEADLRQGKSSLFLADALESLPGVQVQNRFNFAVGERVSIRGFGARAQFGVRGIKVLVDGIPATLPDGQSTLDHVDIASLGRVEALRGPASAMYGNASGGVLLFESEIPSDASAREELTTVGGSDGLLRVQSTTSGTVGDLGYLVSLNRLRFDGYRSTPDGDDYGRAERFHLNARVEQEVAGGELGISLNHLDLDAENPGSLPLAAFEEDPHQVFGTYTFFQTRKEVQQSQLGVSWNGPVGGLTLQTAAYGLTRDFLNPLPGDVVDVDRRAGGLRATLGTTTGSEDMTIRITGGAEFDVQNDDRREFGNAGGEPENLALNQTESVRSAGVFVQATTEIQERVSVVGGLRYDNHRFEVDDLFPVSEEDGNFDDSGSRTMDAFSPAIGVSVAATPTFHLFANFATAFETPTTVELGNRVDGSGGFNPDLDPQTSRTFEVGARGTVSDRIAYEVTLFTTDLENELVPFENADQLTYYRNAGASTRNGAEAAVRAQLHELVTAQLSYSYTDATFDEYTVGDQDYSDNDVPGLAPQEMRASLRAAPSDWFVELGMNYRAEVPVNDSNDAPYAESYTLFDLRAGMSAIAVGSVEFSPFVGVQNLTDETYVSSAAINAFGSRFYEPGPSRSFYLGGTLAVAR